MFFAKVEVNCEGDFGLFGETLERPAEIVTVIPVLEDGDILITFNSHFLGWRNGHAAIVIDADKGRTLEALTLGQNSSVRSVESWENRPAFAVLRLRDATVEKRAEIADYAEDNLEELPYRLTAGMWDWTSVLRKTEDYRAMEVPVAEAEGITETASLTGTHCAHLIWYAYDKFGYNLDSDGGLIVTPRDLYDSPLLEIVQVYGMKP